MGTLNGEFGKLKTKQRHLDRVLDRIQGGNYDRVPAKAGSRKGTQKRAQATPEPTDEGRGVGESP